MKPMAHGHVHHHMETQDGRHAHHQKHSGAVFCALGVLDQPQQQSRIQYQRREDPGKPELFSERRKNEIGIPDRHEAQLILASVAEPLAPEASRADGYFSVGVIW